jgi:hypothetical protein
MKLLKNGATRWVLLAGPYAIKFPSLESWKCFLNGLLANMQERMWWKYIHYRPALCPVLFSIPGGFLVVMPRCRVLQADDEIPMGDLDAFCEREDFVIPAERKCDSFGWYKGNLVAIDYG